MEYSGLDKAISIAVEAHRGQTRANGLPYIMHPMRVMLKVAASSSSVEALSVAILHDVVEDTDLTFGDLQEKGISSKVIESLKLITHYHDESYDEYIKRIYDSGDQIALLVKLSDLEDNMNLDELPNVTEKHLRRNEKYRKARNLLCKVLK